MSLHGSTGIVLLTCQFFSFMFKGQTNTYLRSTEQLNHCISLPSVFLCLLQANELIPLQVIIGPIPLCVLDCFGHITGPLHRYLPWLLGVNHFHANMPIQTQLFEKAHRHKYTNIKRMALQGTSPQPWRFKIKIKHA